MTTPTTQQTYRSIANHQRKVLEETIKRETPAKQHRILGDYDQLIARNIKVMAQEGLYENWESYCFYNSPAELLEDTSSTHASDVILNEKVSAEAVNYFTGGLKTQAQLLNTVEEYLTQVHNVVGQSGGKFPVLQDGLGKAQAQLDTLSQEMETFYEKAKGGKGFLGRLSTMPQRFLSRLGAGSTQHYQLEHREFFEQMIGESIQKQKGTLGMVMSMVDNKLVEQVITESNMTYLNEVADPVSAVAVGMSSMAQLVAEIAKLSAQHGGRLIGRQGIQQLVALHPDIQRTTLENIVHIMGRNAANVAGDPTQITPDLFQAVGRAMHWLPQNAASIPAPPIPGVPDSGGSLLTWLHQLWIKAITVVKGVYAKMYGYLAPKLVAIKAWLMKVWAGGFKGAIAAGKGLLGKASSWLAAKGGVAGLAGKGLTALKAGAAGLAGAAASPAAAAGAALGGAIVAGKSLYSLMSRRKKIEKVLDFVDVLKHLSDGALREAVLSEAEIYEELFGFGSKPTNDASQRSSNTSQNVRVFANKLKPFISDTDALTAELDTEEGHALIQQIATIQAPQVAKVRG